MHIWVLKLKDAIKPSILLELGCQQCQFFFFVSEHFASAPEPAFRLASTSFGSKKMFFCKGQYSTCVLMDIFHVDEKSHGSLAVLVTGIEKA